MLLQNSLLKEPSETLDSSTTFDFSVSVCNSNLFHVAGLLECPVVEGVLHVSCYGFWVFGLRSLGFILGGS